MLWQKIWSYIEPRITVLLRLCAELKPATTFTLRGLIETERGVLQLQIITKDMALSRASSVPPLFQNHYIEP